MRSISCQISVVLMKRQKCWQLIDLKEKQRKTDVDTILKYTIKSTSIESGSIIGNYLVIKSDNKKRTSPFLKL